MTFGTTLVLYEILAIISLYSINLSVFITKAESVYCAVSDRYSFVLKGLKIPVIWYM